MHCDSTYIMGMGDNTQAGDRPTPMTPNNTTTHKLECYNHGQRAGNTFVQLYIMSIFEKKL